MNQSIPPFDLDPKRNPEIFDKQAEAWAKHIQSTNINQVRGFYNEVLTLWDLATREEPELFAATILPLVKMLRPRAYYSMARGSIYPEFFHFIETGAQRVDSFEDFKNFKLFFESVVAFHKYYSEEAKRGSGRHQGQGR